MSDERKRLMSRIKRMVKEHPNLVLEVLLETPFWPEGVDSKEEYIRFGDDDRSFLRICFSEDGDVWPNVFCHPDPELASTPRYRTFFGGGESLRVRAALCMVAKAIMMENRDHPQRRMLFPE